MKLFPKMKSPFGKAAKGRRQYKKKKRKGTLYEGVDFSGSPDRKPVDMFNRPYDPGSGADRLSARRDIIKSRGF